MTKPVEDRAKCIRGCGLGGAKAETTFSSRFSTWVVPAPTSAMFAPQTATSWDPKCRIFQLHIKAELHLKSTTFSKLGSFLFFWQVTIPGNNSTCTKRSWKPKDWRGISLREDRAGSLDWQVCVSKKSAATVSDLKTFFDK